MTDETQNKVTEDLAKKLADDGLLIEAGWISLRHSALPPNAPEIQLREMRKAFYWGAHYLLYATMAFLETDGDTEPTADDMKRMDQVSDELNAFIAKLKQEAN